MYRKKNIQLLTALMMVIIAIIILEFTKTASHNLAVDKKLFQLGNQQEITNISIRDKSESANFKYANGLWLLNDSLRLDQSMRDVFFSVLSSIEIRRPIPSAIRDSVARYVKEYGVQTNISFGEEVIKEYWIGGNKELEISWAMESKTMIPYQVHIPGYQSYVAGIYAVPSIDWRSRFIFTTNFALLSKIEFDYPNSDEQLTLHYKDGFFTIPGVDADSTMIANLLDQLAYLQTEEFLDSKNDLEIIESINPADGYYATLTLTNASGSSEHIKFFTKDAQNSFIVGKTEDGTLCRFRYNRIKDIFKKTSDFE